MLLSPPRPPDALRREKVMPLSPRSAADALSDEDDSACAKPEGSPPPQPPPCSGGKGARGGGEKEDDGLLTPAASSLFPTVVDAPASAAPSSPAAATPPARPAAAAAARVAAPASCSRMFSGDSASDVFIAGASAQQQQQQADIQDSSMALSALMPSPWLPLAPASALSALSLSPTTTQQETRPSSPPPSGSPSSSSPPPPAAGVRFGEGNKQTSAHMGVADFMQRRLQEIPSLVAATAPPPEMPQALSALSAAWSSASWSSAPATASARPRARALFDDLRALHFGRCSELFPEDLLLLLAGRGAGAAGAAGAGAYAAASASAATAAAAAASSATAAAVAACSRRPFGRGPARPPRPQARQPALPLQLAFAHNCRFLGCRSAACDVCRFNPRKACVRSFARRYFAGDSVMSGCAAMLSVEAVVHQGASPAAAAAAAALLHDAFVELTVVDSAALRRSRGLGDRLANGKKKQKKQKKKQKKQTNAVECDSESDGFFSIEDDDESWSSSDGDDDNDSDISAGEDMSADDDDDDSDRDISEDGGNAATATAVACPSSVAAAAAAACTAAAAEDPVDADDGAMTEDASEGLGLEAGELRHAATPPSPFPALSVLSVAASAPPATSPLAMSLLATAMASERKSAPLACLPIVDVALPASVAIERLAAAKRRERKQKDKNRKNESGSSSSRSLSAAAAADRDEEESRATLCLVARLVGADGARLPGTRPAVSEPFFVVSRRAKSLLKRDFPSPDDCATTVEHVGCETLRRLSELAVAARARNQEEQQRGQLSGDDEQQLQQQQQQQNDGGDDEEQELAVVATPEAHALAELLPAGLQRFSTVGDLLRLASAAALSAPLRRALPPFLGVSSRKVAAMARHAGRAPLRCDDRLRVWFSPGLTEALLFSCHSGAVRPDLPVAALCLRPDAESPRALRAAWRVERGLLPREAPADEILSPAHCWRAAAASDGGGGGLRLLADGGRRLRFPGLAVTAVHLVQDLSWDRRMDVERACNLAVDSWWSRGHPGWKVFSMGGKYFTSVVTIQCYLDAIAAGVLLPGEDSSALEGAIEMPPLLSPLPRFQSGAAAAALEGEPEGDDESGFEAASGSDSGEDELGEDSDNDDYDDKDDDEEEDAFAAAFAAAHAAAGGQLFPSLDDEPSPTAAAAAAANAVRSADVAVLASHAGFVDVPPQLRAAVTVMTARRAQQQPLQPQQPQQHGSEGDDDDDNMGIDSDDNGDKDNGNGGEQQPCCRRSLCVPAEALESLVSLSALGIQLRDAEAGDDSEGRARLRAEAVAQFTAAAAAAAGGEGLLEASEADMPGTPKPALARGADAGAASAAAAGAPAPSLVREHHRGLFASLGTLVSSMTDTAPAPAQCTRVAECLRHVATLDISGQGEQQRLADPVANSRAADADAAAADAAAAVAAAAASPLTPGNSAAVATAHEASYGDSGEDAAAAAAAAAASGSSPLLPPALAACACANNLSSSDEEEEDEAAAAAFAAALAAPVATPNRSNARHPFAALGTPLSVPASTAGAPAPEGGFGGAAAAAVADQPRRQQQQQQPAPAAPIFYARAARAARASSPASSDIAHLLSAGAAPSFLVAGAAAAAADNVSCAVGARRFAAAGAAGVVSFEEEDDDCASS